MAPEKRRNQGNWGLWRLHRGGRIGHHAKLTALALLVALPCRGADRCQEVARALPSCAKSEAFPNTDDGPRRVYRVESAFFKEKGSNFVWRQEGGACLTESKLIDLGREVAQLKAENTELKKSPSTWILAVAALAVFGAGFGVALAIK